MKKTSTNTNFGFRLVPEEQKSQLVTNVFKSVAPKYDLMNDLMSLGLHRLWKKWTLFTAGIKPGSTVLDIAGGTGDMSIGLSKLVGKDGVVWHTDINPAMLQIGRKRLIDSGIITPTCLCDAEQLPFSNNYFDGVCVAFGLRNMTHKDIAIAEMYRVLKPGGVLLVLEFSKIHPALASLYDIYSLKVLPLLGKVIAHDSDSYTYLAQSIKLHPDQATLKHMLHQAGFTQVTYHNLTFGITALHKAYKI